MFPPCVSNILGYGGDKGQNSGPEWFTHQPVERGNVVHTAGTLTRSPISPTCPHIGSGQLEILEKVVWWTASILLEKPKIFSLLHLLGRFPNIMEDTRYKGQICCPTVGKPNGAIHDSGIQSLVPRWPISSPCPLLLLFLPYFFMVFLVKSLHKKNLSQESDILDAVFPNQPEGRLVLSEAKTKLPNTLSVLAEKKKFNRLLLMLQCSKVYTGGHSMWCVNSPSQCYSKTAICLCLGLFIAS